MKRALWLVVGICLLAAIFAGCSGKPTNISYDVDTLSQKIREGGSFSDLLSPVDKKMAGSLYGFDSEKVTECALLCSTGATPEEVGIFKCTDEEYAKELLSLAQARVKTQKSTYESYAPGEIPKLDDSLVYGEGQYVFYVVSLDSAKAKEIIKGQ